MTGLSVNLNKIALLRNSRARDYPNVVEYARKFIDLGVQGITVHPRQDERHTTMQDAYDLGKLCRTMDAVEFNIEGYPTEQFLQMVLAIKPDQCTLVPDQVNQLTSDHGWDIAASRDLLLPAVHKLRQAGIRSALFIDPDPQQATAAAETGAHRIEMYTQMYADTFAQPQNTQVFNRYLATAAAAREAAIGVNAGHDLDLNNLPKFLQIPDILEVSIGHALTVECINFGMQAVIESYLKICAGGLTSDS